MRRDKFLEARFAAASSSPSVPRPLAPDSSLPIQYRLLRVFAPLREVYSFPATRHAPPATRHPLRPGFTLIEILVSISILVLLAALVAGAAYATIGKARYNATQVLLKELHAALALRQEKFLQDTQSGMPIKRYQVFAGALSSDSLDDNSILGKRAAILARMDSMRSAFPQSFAEILPSRQLVLAYQDTQQFGNPAAFVGQVNTAANTAFGANSGFASAPIINPYPTHQTILIRYLTATGQIQNLSDFQSKLPTPMDWVMNSATASPPGHDPETESSECLYLILSDNTTGENILEKLGPKAIKDTDGDGLMEIVDSWGHPIKFYRWPTDLWAHFIEVTRQAPSAMLDNSLDQEDLLYDINAVVPFFNNSADLRGGFEMLFARLHLAYYQAPQPMPPFPNMDPSTGANSNFANTPREYPFQPILVSAGSDGQFGLYQRDSNLPQAFSSPAARPQTFLPIRCGRVEEDPARRSYVNDNLYSVELHGEGVKQ